MNLGTTKEIESSNCPAKRTKESPLRGALDRFAQFFLSPLFLSETVDRELQAVDSENKKNLQSDTWRLTQLDRSLSNPMHPYHHFSTGNLHTLRDAPRQRGIQVREEFIKFYKKHYSANRMKLVVLGKESLDELESWVAELFAGVKNKDLPQNRWDEAHPYSENEVLTQVFAKPVMDTRSLDIQFTYQDETYLYESHPNRYISHTIGHEGPGSILAYIKSKGWANGLSAGSVQICPGAGFFHVSVRLTPDGLINYQEVVMTVFQYIALLKKAGPQEWIMNELKNIAEVDFRFKQKTPASSFTSKLSSVMQQPLPREWLLSGQRLIRRFDYAAIAEAMSCLRADNYRLTIVSQEYPGNWNKQERWYGTEYRIERIPESFQASVREALESESQSIPKELHLPRKNEFIPTRLGVEKKELSEPLTAPKLIRNEPGVQAWWKKDDKFWVPKGSFIILLRSALAAATPENSAKANLYCQLVKDALNEYSYDAEIAGLEYSLSSTTQGLHIEVSGYSDKMSVLLEKVLTSMRGLEIKSDRFQIVKERSLRAYRNWSFQQPFQQVGDFTRWLSMERGWINEQYLAELPHLTPNDISVFYPQLLDQIHIEALAHGNLYKEDALRMTRLIETILKPRPLPQAQWQVRRNLNFLRGSDFTHRRPLGDPANVNNCIEYHLHIGSTTDTKLRAKALLLAQLGEEQGFDQLRTKEQLGYIVFTGAKIIVTAVGYRIIIQSERSPEYLEERINAFLVTFGQTLENMTQQEFDGHKRSLINKRLENFKNMSEETSRLWSHITSEYYDFHQVDTDVAALKLLTKSEMVEFFNCYIHPTSPLRAKLSVHLVAQSNPKEIAQPMSTQEQKEKVLDLLIKYLTAFGVGVESDQFAERFRDVNVAEGDQPAILEAVSRYIEDDAEIPVEQSKQILEQLLRTTLPGLGIDARHLTNSGKNNLPEAPAVRETTLIENVAEFKASLAVTAGPRPVVDLSEYEELEPKL